jgi:DNA topoisomerase-2
MADETHVVLSDAEHCLKRPDMFIGSVVKQETTYWQFIKNADTYTVEPKAVVVPPALSQIFLEIATNATDHAAREGTGVKNIHVTMDDATGTVCVSNDGSGIPVRKHRQTQTAEEWLPTVIFSNFRCGENFDDTQERQGAGRNGYGAKCTNAWSTFFKVETQDGAQSFVQVWRDNMRVTEPAVVKKCTLKKTLTKVTFTPDYARFGITDLPAVMAYLRSFVWHLCPVTNAKVNIYLDGEKLPVRNLKDYAKIISTGEVLYDEGAQLQVAVCPAREGFDTIGFVNGIPCHTGTHVNYVLNRLRDDLPMALLKAHVLLMVNVTVNNPTFTSQTKEQLSLDMRKSGVVWEPSAAFVRNFKKSSMVEAVKLEQDYRETRKAKQAVSKGSNARARYVQVDGYESANDAGNTKRSAVTSLILTEGDSAKAFAVSGLSVVGRDHFGVFPLRGKLKNVRGEKLSSILQTVEIANILKILGADLLQGAPQSTRELRYDRVVIMTDQDVDGAHIAGLIINALMVLLPDVFKNEPTFVQRFATPLVRAFGKRGQPDLEFMTEREYLTWNESAMTEGIAKNYEIKYFKGLGTSTPRDAKICFVGIDRYLITIDCQQLEDHALLEDFFDSKRAGRRKELLMEPMDNDAVDYTSAVVSLGRFLKCEMLPFSRYNNERSIAHAVDGLKPALRKILWVLLSGGGLGAIKVAQLSGEVAKKTHYKHGENSLNETIIKMAQDFPLSGNNINLLVPDGMFGNRHGDEPASPRYIYTRAEAIAFALFPKADFPSYDMLVQEGSVIEPAFMVPVLPLVLLNGTSGIGTGFSSNVASYNPADVIRWVLAYIAHCEDDALPMPVFDSTPWLADFQGSVEQKGPRSFHMFGLVEATGPSTLRVTELPYATNEFRYNAKKKDDLAFLDKFPHHCVVNNTDIQVDLHLHFERDVDDHVLEQVRERTRVTVDTGNMHLWTNDQTYPRLFASPDDILLHHASVRLALYEKRRTRQLAEIELAMQRHDDESRFIHAVITDPAVLIKQPREAIEAYLSSNTFALQDESYDYLLRLPMSSMTAETLAKLDAQKATQKAAKERLLQETALSMWKADVHTVQAAYDVFLATRLERRAMPEVGEPRVPLKRKAGTSGPRAKKVKT